MNKKDFQTLLAPLISKAEENQAYFVALRDRAVNVSRQLGRDVPELDKIVRDLDKVIARNKKGLAALREQS
jgi:hypothetical protein